MKTYVICCLFIFQNFLVFCQQTFISPDGKKEVIISQFADGRYKVYVNKSPHNFYKRIIKNKIYFFSDTYSVAYIAKCDDGFCVVIDGIEGAHYKEIYTNRISFSPDLSHYAYLAIKENLRACYVIDGKEQPEYDGIMVNGITFSQDSKQWAYAVLNNNEWFYIINGIEQPHYSQVSTDGIYFSADNKHWAYKALKKGKWICILDGDESIDNSDICKSYLPEETSIDFIEFGWVSCNSILEPLDGDGPSPSSFLGEYKKSTLDDGGVILPKLEDNRGLIISIGAQQIEKGFGVYPEISYTLLFPKGIWNNKELKVRYYFLDAKLKLSYAPVRILSFDMLYGINLLTRMKIKEAGFVGEYGNTTRMENVKLSGGIFRGFPFNVSGGLGVSCIVTPKYIISLNAYARYVVFPYASGPMGKNRELYGWLSSASNFLGWAHDPNFNFQISARYVIE